MKCTIILLGLQLVSVDVLGQQIVTPDGPVKGIAQTTNTGSTYYAYFSLRYAKPPTGSRRFLAPEAVDPWTDVYDGSTENTNVCYQFYQDLSEETEDCLFLNVFTPQDPSASSRNLPVMINIHGGGFLSGTGHSGGSIGGISPKYFMETDVIMITINYRLGIFGFLSTGDTVIPGNAGLKDIIMALKWIQRNIAAFGGDPSKVTVFGQSAGSAAVGYLLLSPTAKGLFSSAIAESGSCLSPWAYQRNQTDISFKAGSFIDSQFVTSRDSQALLRVMQAAPAKDLDNAALSYGNWATSQPDAFGNLAMRQGMYFAPVVEAVNNDDAFLTEKQYEALAEGNFNQVPTLMGMTSEEGLMNLDAYIDYVLQAFDRNNGYMNPQDIHIKNPSDWETVANLIKQEYSPSTPFASNKLAAIQFFTEQDFAKAVVKHAELQSAHSDVYFYQFSYTGQMSGNTQFKFPGSGNVTHVEEWMYIFGGGPMEWYPANDQLIHNRLIRLWTNFATYHNPTPNQDELLQNIIWPKVQPTNFQYLNIGNYDDTNMVIVQNKPKAERVAFWNSVYETYGNRPFDTY